MELRVSGHFVERTVKERACRRVCCYFLRLSLQCGYLIKPEPMALAKFNAHPCRATAGRAQHCARTEASPGAAGAAG